MTIKNYSKLQLLNYVTSCDAGPDPGGAWGGHGPPKWRAGHPCGHPIWEKMFSSFDHIKQNDYYVCPPKFLVGPPRCHPITHRLDPPLARSK